MAYPFSSQEGPSSSLHRLPTPSTHAPSTTLSKPTRPGWPLIHWATGVLTALATERHWNQDGLWILRTFLFLPKSCNPPFSTLKSFHVKVWLWKKKFFFFLLFRHTFWKFLCSPWSVSNPATPDSEVQIGLRGLFSPIRLWSCEPLGDLALCSKLPAATGQLNTLSCRPGCWHRNHRNHPSLLPLRPKPTCSHKTFQCRWTNMGASPGLEAKVSHPLLVLCGPRGLHEHREEPGRRARCTTAGTLWLRGPFIMWRSCWQAIQNGTSHHNLRGQELGLPVLCGKNGK